MEKAVKAEGEIARVCRALGVTPDGRRWLDVALDPFKDVPQRPDGYPDLCTAKSCSQKIHSTFVIKKPDSVSDGTNWDCHIFLDPTWMHKKVMVTPSDGPIFEQTGQAAISEQGRGGLVVRGAATGVALGIGTTMDAYCQSMDTVVFQDGTDCRCYAMGFEVHDTTQELKKQGSVIVYRVADDCEDEYCVTGKDNATATNNGVYEGIRLPEPPLTAQEAVDLPQSQQWLAKEGVYVVPLFNSNENPPSYLQNRPLIMEEGGSTYTQKINNTVLNYYFQDPSNLKLPFTLSGAYFQGLDSEASLTVNWDYYVQQFPAYNSPLKRIADRQPADDPAALKMYSELSKVMPTGCPVNQNFLGTFISGIANAAKALLPKVATVLPKIIQGAQIASNVINALQPSGENEGTQLVKYVSRPNNNNNNNSSGGTIVTRPPVRNNEVIVNTVIEKKPVSNREMVVYQDTTVKNVNTGRTRHVRNEQVIVKNNRNKNYNRTYKLMKKSNYGNRWKDFNDDKK